MLPTLDATTDLYEYAKAVFGTSAPRRIQLFSIPAFIELFRSLPIGQQLVHWHTLMQNRNGKTNTLMAKLTLDEWYRELSHDPQAFNFQTHIWTVGACCPEYWLREQMAQRFEHSKATQTAPCYTFNNRITGVLKSRTRNRKVLMGTWVKAMTDKLVGELDDQTYALWLGQPDETPKFPLTLCHEKAVQTGRIEVDKHTIGLMSHPSTLAMYVPNRPRAAPQRPRTLALTLDEDRIARVQASVRADITLINLGGSIKDLGQAVKQRMGTHSMPSFGALYLYYDAFIQHHALLDKDARIRIGGQMYKIWDALAASPKVLDTIEHKIMAGVCTIVTGVEESAFNRALNTLKNQHCACIYQL